MLKGINNFLWFINQNWTSIAVCIGLLIMLYRKLEEYISKSEDEKVEIAKKQIKEIILNLVSKAEANYIEWNKAGSIKRSEVIQEIYERYPLLEDVVNQEELIKFIDDAIDEALVTLRKVIEENKDSFDLNAKEEK